MSRFDWSDVERRTELITGGTPPRAVRAFGLRDADALRDSRPAWLAPAVPAEPSNPTGPAYADWRTETLGLIGRHR